MVTTPLVTPDITWGKTILGALDDAKFPVSAAFWLLGDDDKWELVIATPLYDELGQDGAYRKLIDALQPTGSYLLGDLPLRLEKVERPLIRGLKRMYGHAPTVEGKHLYWHAIDGLIIREAILYRIAP